jgi:hypothetical protein
VSSTKHVRNVTVDRTPEQAQADGAAYLAAALVRLLTEGELRRGGLPRRQAVFTNAEGSGDGPSGGPFDCHQLRKDS